MRKFVLPNNPILSIVAKKLSKKAIQSDETKDKINQMLEVAYGEQKDRNKPILVGLAAPQIGISKRIILVDIKANGKGEVGGPPAGGLRIYLNPEIIWSSEEENEWYEGCFSTDRVCGVVSRPTAIKIKAFSLTPQGWEAKVVEEDYRGYTARIFQHEIDHLNGKEFVTHITDPEKLHWVQENEFPIYRNQEAWRNWPKKCSFGKWKEIKFSE